VRATEASRLIARALHRGVDVVGFRFDVGDQAGGPVPLCTAVYETLTLMGRLESQLPVRFEVLDIGGGMSTPSDRDGAALEEIAACIRPMLAARSTELDIVAEFSPTAGEAQR
jgi:ornithine decarboxylase